MDRGRAAAAARRSAVEIGPGSGIYLPLLCDLFEEVVAADVEDAFLARARATPRTYVAYVTGRSKLRVGTHVPVEIRVDGQSPIKLKVTLARKFWK